MDNLKRIGLSALAGTLASLSAQAGEMTVTGSAEISYVQRDSDELTGNPIGNEQEPCICRFRRTR